MTRVAGVFHLQYTGRREQCWRNVASPHCSRAVDDRNVCLLPPRCLRVLPRLSAATDCAGLFFCGSQPRLPVSQQHCESCGDRDAEPDHYGDDRCVGSDHGRIDAERDQHAQVLVESLHRDRAAGAQQAQAAMLQESVHRYQEAPAEGPGCKQYGNRNRCAIDERHQENEETEQRPCGQKPMHRVDADVAPGKASAHDDTDCNRTPRASTRDRAHRSTSAGFRTATRPRRPTTRR